MIIDDALKKKHPFLVKCEKQGYAIYKLDFQKILYNLAKSTVNQYNYIDYVRYDILGFSDFPRIKKEANYAWGEAFGNRNKGKGTGNNSVKIKRLISYNPNDIPYVIIDVEAYGKTRRVDLKTIINTKEGEIALHGSNKLILDIDSKFGGTRYKLLIPYSNLNDNAIIFYLKTFRELLYVLKKIDLPYSKRSKESINYIFSRKFAAAKNDPDILDELYFLAPPFVLNNRDEKLLWNDLSILLSQSVNEYGTNEEVAVLNILNALKSDKKFSAGQQSSDNFNFELSGGHSVANPKADEYLENLLATYSNGKPLLKQLYTKMNDWGGADNFTALMNILYIVWVQSSHFLLEAYQIEYKSEELLGFYETSHDFILSKDARKIAGIKFYNNLSEFRPAYMGSIGVYHRVGLINSSKIETPENIKIPTILPAFFLMGIDDKTAAANTETAIGVAVEVLTTLTGIGNLTKFRHLYRIWKATSTYSKTLVAIKIGISAIEITSGALGTMLTLAGSNCNGKFCDGLRNVLFWMDLASLSVDLTTSRMLKNSAKQTLKNLDSLPKMNQIEYDELVESLERIAGVKVTKNTGVKKKKTATFKQFVEKWNGKNIKNLSKSEIIENLKGYTDQGNKIARALEKKEIKMFIMTERKFKKAYKKYGDGSLDGYDNTEAFAYGDEMYFKTSYKNPNTNLSVEKFMSQLVHEGTHTIDSIDDFAGNNWSWEKRAYFWERQFQMAIDLDPEFETIEELLEHIKNNYNQY